MDQVSKNRTISRFDIKLLFPAFTHISLQSCRYYDYHVIKVPTSNVDGVWPNIIMHKSRFLRHGRLHRFQPNGFRHISWLARAIVTVLGDDVEDELVSIGSLLALQRLLFSKVK